MVKGGSGDPLRAALPRFGPALGRDASAPCALRSIQPGPAPLCGPLLRKGARPAQSRLACATALWLGLQPCLLCREFIVMLHQRLELSPCALLRVVHFLETIQPQQFGELKGIDAVAFVAGFGDPGIVTWMGADYARHQRPDNGRGPRRQLARFQMYMHFTSEIGPGSPQIHFTGAQAAIHDHRSSCVK